MTPSLVPAATPSNDLGPGMLAFVAFLFLAICLWFLMRNMSARLRRMSYRERQSHDPAGSTAPSRTAADEERPADEPPARP